MSAARLVAADVKRQRRAEKRSRDAANDNSRRRSTLVQSSGRYLFPDEIQARNTGRRQDIGAWLERQEKDATLREQSDALAAALERAGVQAYSAIDDEADFDHVLETVTPLPERYRSVKFLPLVMQRDSAAMLAALRYFMHNHTLGKFMRMATITGGVRIPAFGDLRGRQKGLCRAVSAWAHECEHRWGVSVLFRSVEFTRLWEEAIQAGTYHVHGHVLYAPRRYLGEAGWVEFLQWSEKFLRARLKGAKYAFEDCGRISEPDEACKYTFKPGELANLSDDEVAWLYHETFRANMKQPLREFKTFRQQMATNTRPNAEGVTVKAPLKVVNVWGQDGAPRLEVVYKRQRSKADTERDTTQERDDTERTGDRRKRENYIVFTGNPTATAVPFATVKTRVIGYTENPTTLEGFEGLARLRAISEEVQAYWQANKAPPVMRIPLELDAWAARETGALRALERQAAAIDADHDSQLAADIQTKRRRIAQAVELAGRLRAAYEVHTCRLSVLAESAGAPQQEAQDSPPEVTRWVIWERIDPETGEITEERHPAQPNMGRLVPCRALDARTPDPR